MAPKNKPSDKSKGKNAAAEKGSSGKQKGAQSINVSCSGHQTQVGICSDFGFVNVGAPHTLREALQERRGVGKVERRFEV